MKKHNMLRLVPISTVTPITPRITANTQVFDSEHWVISAAARPTRAMKVMKMRVGVAIVD